MMHHVVDQQVQQGNIKSAPFEKEEESIATRVVELKALCCVGDSEE